MEIGAADKNMQKLSERNQGGKKSKGNFYIKRNLRDPDVLKCQQKGDERDKPGSYGVLDEWQRTENCSSFSFAPTPLPEE